MNCIFIKARKISKSLKGNRGSVVNYSKYLTRELQDIDYAEKGRIIDCGIVGTDEKTVSFWKKAEDRENQTKRKDSARFAKEYILALPHQLPMEEQNQICKDVAEYLAQGNRVVSWYQHEPDKEGDDRNFHCHFLMSEREYINGQFAEKKNRTWNEKSFLTNQKKEIGKQINIYLERQGIEPIQIEIEEDRETAQDKTEKQVKAERALKKRAEKIEKKMKLAEVKINGLRGTINRPTDNTRTEQTGNNSIDNQLADFKQRERERIERLRIEQARQLAERNARRNQEISKRNDKPRRTHSDGWER